MRRGARGWDGRTRAGAAAAALACAAALAGCGPTGKYIWVDAVPRSMLAQDMGSAIAPGDVIGVRVWNQEANSVERERVRDDGKISLPLLNDVEVAGMEPSELARRLEVKLKPFIVNPVVTVLIHERRPTRVTVVGNVGRPGVYEVDRGAGVLFAIAAAGGLSPFASKDAIFVLRSGYWADSTPSTGRIRFRYSDLRQGNGPGASFQLRSGDAVVVE